MNYYLTLALVLLGYMTMWFIASLVKKRNDVVDTAWGLGFVLIAWLSFFLSGNSGLRGILIVVLVSIWGIRLAWHIDSRNKHKTEDYRYLAWRKKWAGLFYLRSYFQIYILQGFLLYLIALPIIFINKSNEPALNWVDLAGLAVWIFGFYFEVRADRELARFVKHPANKGKIMQRGLWAYSRHPNYFGEVILWWGIWLIALSAQYGWISVIGPITITVLILRISGIPMLEKKMEENPEFIEYKKKVSVFIPLPRKNL